MSVKKEKYDFVIDLHSKILSRIIGIKLKNSKTKYFCYKKRKWWKTLLVKAKIIDYNADCTIVESYFSALKKLGIEFSWKNKKKWTWGCAGVLCGKFCRKKFD